MPSSKSKAAFLQIPDVSAVIRVILITLVVAAILTSPTYVPKLWGCQWRYIGTSQGCWSNCAPGGIPPGSWCWSKRQSSYHVGDFVTYRFRNSFLDKSQQKNAVSEEEEPTIHPIVGVDRGRYRIRGMNEANSDPAHWVPQDAIDGKVVAVVRWLPESYWRWVTLDWTLEYESIMARQRGIWSPKTLTALYSTQGKTRLRLVNTYATDQVAFSPGGKWAMLTMPDGSFKFIDCRTNQTTSTIKPAKKHRGASWVDQDMAALMVTNGHIYMWPDGRWKRTLEFPDAGSLSYTMGIGRSALPAYQQNKGQREALEALNPRWSEVPEGIVLGVIYQGPPVVLEVNGKDLGLGGRCTLVGGAEYHLFPKPVEASKIKTGKVDVTPPFLLYAVKS